MDRIPYLFDTTNRAARWTGVAAMLLAVLAAFAMPGTSYPRAFADGAAAAEEPLFDLGCAQRDLDLVTLIERNGNNGFSTTATLVESADLLETARSACSVGDIDSAHALYDTALRRLQNPSDLARR